MIASEKQCATEAIVEKNENISVVSGTIQEQAGENKTLADQVNGIVECFRF